MNLECSEFLTSVINVLPRPNQIIVPITMKIGEYESTEEVKKLWVYNKDHTSVITKTNVDSFGISILRPIVLEGEGLVSSKFGSLEAQTSGWKIYLRSLDSDQKYACNIQELTDTSIKCLMASESQPPIFQPLALTIENDFGYAAILTEEVNDEFIVLLPAVTSIISENSGSMSGGFHLQLSGVGLDHPKTKVLLDHQVDAECDILQSNYHSMTCQIPGYKSGDPHDILEDVSREIVVTLQCEDSNTELIFDNHIEDPYFHYKRHLTPHLKTLTTNTKHIQRGTKISWTFEMDIFPNETETHEHDEIDNSAANSLWYNPETNGEHYATISGTECIVDKNNLGCVVADTVAAGRTVLKLFDAHYGHVFIKEEMMSGENFLAPSKLLKVYPHCWGGATGF